MRRLVSLLAACSLAACSSERPESSANGTWVGTITTEGNVTTVVNEAGSVWGGTATLVEEASIGVEAGADEYMFGSVRSVYITSDRIYLTDTQIPTVRAYEHDGTFITAFGREGQGPGEYEYPRVVAANESGRVFVLDDRLTRINVYASSGESIDTWPLENTSCCNDQMFPLDDGIWKPVNQWIDGLSENMGAQAVGPSGSHGEVMWRPVIEYERATYKTVSGYDVETPFSPRLLHALVPGGKLVAGASDRYRFEVLSPDGSRLVVERHWEPVPVPAEHKEWVRQREIVFDREYNDPEQTLDGSLIPDHKPAFSWFVPAQSGEIWVKRQGPSERLPDCPGDPFDVGNRAARERPCWRDHLIIDAFGDDGRYRGEVEVPEALQPYANTLAISGRVVVAAVEDDAGTIMVKRYRLVLPGEEGQ